MATVPTNEDQDENSLALHKRVKEIDDQIKTLSEERDGILRSLGSFENFSTGPNVHAHLSQLLLIRGPVLSIDAPLHWPDHYYTGHREQHCRSLANKAREEYLKAIDMLASLESNLGNQKLPERWGYHVKFKIQQWRKQAQRGFKEMYEALAREMELRYVRVYEKQPLDARAAELRPRDHGISNFLSLSEIFTVGGKYLRTIRSKALLYVPYSVPHRIMLILEFT
ncbi:MAG: hypothetical protein Q9181_005547 [Wetmoreana brouardii]